MPSSKNQTETLAVIAAVPWPVFLFLGLGLSWLIHGMAMLPDWYRTACLVVVVVTGMRSHIFGTGSVMPLIAVFGGAIMPGMLYLLLGADETRTLFEHPSFPWWLGGYVALLAGIGLFAGPSSPRAKTPAKKARAAASPQTPTGGTEEERPPRIVTLCGSTRFARTFEEWNVRLTLEGAVVLSIVIPSHAYGLAWSAAEKARLDAAHRAKIDLSHEIFVLDVGGYVGESTQGEIDHARATGKTVRRLSELHPEWDERTDCRYAQAAPSAV